MALSPEELRAQEDLHKEQLARALEERQASIDALQADMNRLRAEEADRTGATLKARQEHKESVEQMTDLEFDKHEADLLRQSRREQQARSGAVLTLKGKHDA